MPFRVQIKREDFSVAETTPDFAITIEEWSVEITCDTLRNLHAAIRKWSDDAYTALDQRIEQFKSENGGNIPEHYDFSDDAFSIHTVERSMYGGLAVAIASAAERYVKPHITKEKARGMTEKDAQARVAGMDGHASYNCARILGNCFKHAEGKVTEDYVKAFKDGLSLGEEVDFLKEDWRGLIDGTKRLIMFIVKHP
jgi:hypothetical protein